VVALQIGRSPRSDLTVAFTCHLGLPVTVQTPPILEDGTPFPTRYWLTCPLAVKRISRVESAGGVKKMDARAVSDARFAGRLKSAHLRYEAERNADLPARVTHRPSGGLAGSRKGVKCLHAHYADTRAGNANPVGELVAPWVEPLDCPVPCVIDAEGLTLGTYLHGLFHNRDVRRSILAYAGARRGLSLPTGHDDIEPNAEYDKLASLVRAHRDMGLMYGLMGLEP